VVQQRKRIGKFVCSAGVVCWAAPIIAIQGLAHVGYLEEFVPGFVRFLQRTGWYKWVTGYLPVVALLVLDMSLPYALEVLAVHWEYTKVKSEVQRLLLRRSLRFQLATIYVTVFSGSLWKSLWLIVDKPSCTATILGKAVPSTAVYFTTFIVAKCGTTLPWMLLYGPVRSYVFGFSPASPAPLRCAFAAEAANLALVFVVGLTYAVVAPTVLPACALYFAGAALTYRWLFCNVYEAEFSCAGLYWCDLFNGAMLGLLFGTGALAGLLSTFVEDLGVALQVIWVLAMTISYHHYRWNILYQPLCLTLPYEDAIAVDNDQGEYGCKSVVAQFDPECYLDPIMKHMRNRTEEPTQSVPTKIGFALLPSAASQPHPSQFGDSARGPSTSSCLGGSCLPWAPGRKSDGQVGSDWL